MNPRVTEHVRLTANLDEVVSLIDVAEATVHERDHNGMRIQVPCQSLRERVNKRHVISRPTGTLLGSTLWMRQETDDRQGYNVSIPIPLAAADSAILIRESA